MARRQGSGTTTEQTIDLSRLYFGKDDAESDIARRGLLKQGFMKTHAYEEALRGTKSLIIGRKGSGKSAICLMLLNSIMPEHIFTLVTPDEISAEEIRRFQLPGIPQEQSKSLIWRYVFCVQIAKYLLDVGKSDRMAAALASQELSAIRQFLLDNEEIEDLSFSQRFWKIIERLKGSLALKAFSLEAKVEAEMRAPSPGTRTGEQIDLLETSLRSAADKLKLGPGSPAFHILVDQIEKVWSNDKESDSMVVGLLIAAKEIQAKFGFVICTIFLRTDIYEQLQFQDRDKFRGDEFHIEWDEPRLQELILNRANASLGASHAEHQLWPLLFPQRIEEKPAKTFIVLHTLMRPRDIIQLCNACRDKARTNGRNKIEIQDIRESLALYSNWKLSDLQNEWSVNYPFLPDVFILLTNANYFVKREHFASRLAAIRQDLASRYPSLVYGLSEHELLSVLYSIGLLGVTRNGQTVYVYQEHHERRIRPEDTEFVIHPCFRYALHSTSAINLVPFQSAKDEDYGSIRSAILSGDRVNQFPSLRGSKGFQINRSLRRDFEELRTSCEKASFPADLRDEINSNLRMMIDQMTRDEDEEDTYLASHNLVGVLQHISRMERNLREGGWLEQKRELQYRFAGLSRTLGEYITDRRYEEFR